MTILVGYISGWQSVVTYNANPRLQGLEFRPCQAACLLEFISTMMSTWYAKGMVTLRWWRYWLASYNKYGWLFAGVSPQRSEFNSRSVYGGVCGGQSGIETFFLKYFGSRLSASFHQCAMLIPLVFTKAIKRQKLPLSLNDTLKIMVKNKWQTHTGQIL